MGRKSKQHCMVILDMEDLIPQDHQLRKIKEKIDFNFIYEEAKSYYSKTGRPSIDPVCLMKMLLVGYLSGVYRRRILTICYTKYRRSKFYKYLRTFLQYSSYSIP